jgi:hypothetical protein
VDCEWLDSDALDSILRLAEAGLRVCLKRQPREPGRIPTPDHRARLGRLLALPNVGTKPGGVPLVTGATLPQFWCREGDDDLLIFFGHPMTAGLTYPLRYGQSYCDETVVREVGTRGRTLRLEFRPYQSVLVRVSRTGAARFENIEFVPRLPRTG